MSIFPSDSSRDYGNYGKAILIAIKCPEKLSEFDSHITTMNIDIIMSNTYGVLTNRCSVEDILEQYKDGDAMFYGNPYDMTLEDVDEVINYFENTEEYEKCSELVNYRNDLDIDIFLERLANINGVTMY